MSTEREPLGPRLILRTTYISECLAGARRFFRLRSLRRGPGIDLDRGSFGGLGSVENILNINVSVEGGHIRLRGDCGLVFLASTTHSKDEGQSYSHANGGQETAINIAASA